MSTPLGGRTRAAAARTAPRVRPPVRRPARDRLRVVAGRQPGRHGGAFVGLVVAVLAAGLVGLLVLNTAMQRTAFQLDDLRDRADALRVRQQVLDLRVDRLSSPQLLAERAESLGMVSIPGRPFLDLADGSVLGDPVPAVAGSGPDLVDAPAPRAVPEPVRTPPAPPARTPAAAPAGAGATGADAQPDRQRGDDLRGQR